MKIIKGMECVFSKKNQSVETIKPGEIVEFHTIDCFGGQVKSEEQFITEIDFSLANPTAGPVYIEGAQNGDVLIVDIIDIEVAKTGISCIVPGMGPLKDQSTLRTKVFQIENDYSMFNDVKMKIEPMIGVIGVAPKDEDIPTGLTGSHGGNMDSRLIKKGSRVYLPVSTNGALLQIGDLHAVMGDGELCGTGLEVDGKVVVKVELIKNFELNYPVTQTNDKWYVNSTGKDYDDSLVKGVQEMTRLMTPVYNWDVEDISIYLSLQGSVEVNQGIRPDPHGGMVNLRIGIPKVVNKDIVKK